MSRSVRLFEMTHMLAGRRSRTLDELVDAFAVSERTVYRDLADLGRMVPLIRDEHGYRLLEGATLKPLNLTAEEHALLRVALENPALRRQGALEKTVDSLHHKLDAAVRHLEESPMALQLAGPSRAGELRRGVLETLQQSIRDGRAAEIHYTSLSGAATRWRSLDPLRLFERGGAWYLAGHCHLHDEIRLFRLDRMEAARGLERRSRHRPNDFDLDRFLADSWGIFVGHDRHEVHLVFDPPLAPLLCNAQHHDSESVEVREDGRIDYRVTLCSLEEIAVWVLGFGARVEVVAPDQLRRRVIALAEGALARAAETAGA